MKLTLEGLNNYRAEWQSKDYKLPTFDFEAVRKKTKESPEWIHFGAGNIFRAFQANVVQELLNSGKMETGLIVAEGFDYEIIEKMYQPHDNLGILATLKVNGSVEKTVIGSIMESLILDSNNESMMTRLEEIFSNPSLKMASFTITEKGYSLVDGKGSLLPSIVEDFANGPVKAQSYLGKVAGLLYVRFKNGALPIAMVSMDNCSHNGDKLKDAMVSIATKWVENQKAEPEFLAYLKDASKVSFPWSMIDKITPRPDTSVMEILKNDNIENLEPVITSKNTYVAPFVNAEECQYLVIEDAFPNGKPDLTPGGIIFTKRETVDQVEKMKVCTCLNPLHTTLAVFGCLMGYTLISKELQNEDLAKLIHRIGYVEGLPVVVNPGIIDPKKFIDEVVNVRIPNPFMPDTPQRIATDTSQKLPIRFGETIKAYCAASDKNVQDLVCIPLVFAGWLRYIMAIDDEGKTFEPSSDPMLSAVVPMLSKVTFGKTMSADSIHEILQPILSMDKIFGVNLYEVGLGELTEQYFASMIQGPGAVATTIHEVLNRYFTHS